MKYRKKPVVIEAIKWTGNNAMEIKSFVGVNATHLKGDDVIIIITLEGNHKAIVGDMIIKGVQGEFYPCKPDIFAKTYEKAAQKKVESEPSTSNNTSSFQLPSLEEVETDKLFIANVQSMKDDEYDLVEETYNAIVRLGNKKP